jgi:hypothetical protein
MDKLDIVFCGCTINSANYIEKTINKLIEFKSLFQSCNIIIYENDSNDNTTSLLKNLESQNKITAICETGIKSKLKLRTLIIAHARNILVQEVLKNKKYMYMIMIDLDGLLDNFNKKCFTNAFNYDLNSWDALFTNSNGRYYDIWALRFNKQDYSKNHQKIWGKHILDYDCWDMINHERFLKRIVNKNLHIKTFQKKIPKKCQLLKVDSAFGGMGIYKVSKIINCKYEGFTRQCSCEKYFNNKINKCRFDTCEHVSFHRDMILKNNAKLFICPQLIVNCQTEHLS